MRLYPSKVDDLVLLVKSKKIRAVLLYGPEIGTLNWILSKLGALFEITQEISPNDIDELILYLKSQDLFQQSKMVKVIYTSKLDKKIETLVNQKYDYFPLIIGSEISSTNSLRKFFESNDKLVSIGCYPDNEKTIESFIAKEVSLHKKRISKDAVSYIIAHCENNRLIISNEISKLALYVNSDTIGIQDVVNVLSAGTSHEVDELCFAFMFKDAYKYFRLLTKIKNTSDIEPIMIIRAFIRYYNKLFMVKRYYNLEEGIASLKPPIFFAHIESFRIAAKNTSPQEIAAVLKILDVAEEKIKSHNNNNSIIEEIYFSIFEALNTKIS